MTALFVFRALTTIGVWTLEATAVLCGAWVITLFIRKNAAMRHLTWLMAFCGLLLIPVFSAIVPSHITVRVPAPVLGVAAMPRSNSVLRPTLAGETLPTHRQTHLVLAESPGERNELAGIPRRRFDWRPPSVGLLGIWAFGVVAVIAHLTFALYRLGAIRRNCTPGDLDDSYLTGLAAKVRLERMCEVCVSSSGRLLAAMTWSCTTPIIVLPKGQADWTPDRLEAILLHEFAHVKRCDSSSQLVALGACAVFWFNPAVWLSLMAMRAEAESAADDLVLRAGVRPSAYATELLRIAAELGGLRQPFALVGVSIMRKCRIETRVKAIVDPAKRRRGVTFAESMLIGGAGLISIPLLASMRPSIEFVKANWVPPIVSVSALPLHLRSSAVHKSGTKNEECPGPEEESTDDDSAIVAGEARLSAPQSNRIPIISASGIAMHLPLGIRANLYSLKVRNETPSDYVNYQVDDSRVPDIAVIKGDRIEDQDKRLVMRDANGARREIRSGFGGHPDIRGGYNGRPEVYEPTDQPQFGPNMPAANPARRIYPPPTPDRVGPSQGAIFPIAVDVKMNVGPFYKGPMGFKFEGDQFGPHTKGAPDPTRATGPVYKWRPQLADEIRGQLRAAEAGLEAAIKSAPQRPEIIGQLKGILAGFRANKAREIDRLLRFHPRSDEWANLDDQMKGFEERVNDWARAMADEAHEREEAIHVLIDAQNETRDDRDSAQSKDRRGRSGPCDKPLKKTPN